MIPHGIGVSKQLPGYNIQIIEVNSVIEHQNQTTAQQTGVFLQKPAYPVNTSAVVRRIGAKQKNFIPAVYPVFPVSLYEGYIQDACRINVRRIRRYSGRSYPPCLFREFFRGIHPCLASE